RAFVWGDPERESGYRGGRESLAGAVDRVRGASGGSTDATLPSFAPPRPRCKTIPRDSDRRWDSARAFSRSPSRRRSTDPATDLYPAARFHHYLHPRPKRSVVSHFLRGFTMRSKFLPLAALFAFTPALRADDAADARAVVEKAVKVLGHKPGDKPGAVTWK